MPDNVVRFAFIAAFNGSARTRLQSSALRAHPQHYWRATFYGHANTSGLIAAFPHTFAQDCDGRTFCLFHSRTDTVLPPPSVAYGFRAAATVATYSSLDDI